MNKSTLIAPEVETLLPRLLRSRVLLPKGGEQEMHKRHSPVNVPGGKSRLPSAYSSPFSMKVVVLSSVERVSTSDSISVLDTPNAPVMNKSTLIAPEVETLLPRLLRSRVLLPKGGEQEGQRNTSSSRVTGNGERVTPSRLRPRLS